MCKKNPLSFNVQKQQQYIHQLELRLHTTLNRIVTHKQHQLANLCGKLDGLSPLKVLARGYSIAEDVQGKAITEISQVNVGDKLKTRVANGEIVSEVVSTQAFPEKQSKRKQLKSN